MRRVEREEDEQQLSKVGEKVRETGCDETERESGGRQN